MDTKLSDIYYKPENLWKGNIEIKKLTNESGINKKDVKKWLNKQAFWQVHRPPPRIIRRPHYEITKPNKMHQFDMLYMPHDTFYGNKYKYILSGIDDASRYKVARPMKTKKAKDVAKMLKVPLTKQNILSCIEAGRL